jgi:hypothetical protein
MNKFVLDSRLICRAMAAPGRVRQRSRQSSRGKMERVLALVWCGPYVAAARAPRPKGRVKKVVTALIRIGRSLLFGLIVVVVSAIRAQDGCPAAQTDRLAKLRLSKIRTFYVTKRAHSFSNASLRAEKH